jgi:hypothetical protein
MGPAKWCPLDGRNSATGRVKWSSTCTRVATRQRLSLEGVFNFCFSTDPDCIDVIRWLHAHGYSIGMYACEWAATIGNLDALKWCHANGLPWNSRLCLAPQKMNISMYWNGLERKVVLGIKRRPPKRGI